MQRRGWAVIGLGLLTWVACVGADPEATAPSEGGIDQQCFDNGTCQTGLSCIAGRCQAANTDDPTDGGRGKSDDAGEKVVEAGVDAAACVPFPDTEPNTACGAAPCENENVCCKVGGGIACLDPGGCEAADIVWSCEDKHDCVGGQAICCISGSPTDGAMCSVAIEDGVSRCVYDADECAAPTQFFGCASDDECVGTCEPLEVRTTGGFTVVVKVCR